MKQPAPKSEKEALQILAARCARCEVCESEARTRLYRMGLEGEAAERVIDSLVAGRFVDDRRYARAFAGDKARFSGWGRAKISMALRAKGIDSAYIAEALDAIDHDIYADALMKRARAAARGLNLGDYKDRSKLYRRLLSRGYESALVSSVISHLSTHLSL